jgi:ubiquinone/menaquinone biosynthesis C-methylase UbiE
MSDFESEYQQQYYTQTSQLYDDLHLLTDQEHNLALHLLKGYISYYGIQSLLDLGAGTGRSLLWLKEHCPEITRIQGIEPVAALREQGYQKGLSPEELIDGDAYKLPFPDNSFDLVSEFAVLHHVRHPHLVIQEMSRVASKMICISDSNFMGQGSPLIRLIKYILFSSSLWPAANWIKTKGKGYLITQEDGLAYSYSVFQDYKTLQKYWKTLRCTTTKGTNDFFVNLMLSSEQLLLIGLEKKE